MNAGLFALTEKIKKQARFLGFSLKTSSMLNNESVILSNSASGKVVLVGVVEVSGTLVTVAYSVDPYKWSWAEKEGFTKDQITTNPKLSSEIFTEINIDKIAESLL